MNPQNNTLQQLLDGKLQGIKRLDLACGLTEFPNEIFDLADSLETLNLTGNQLKTLPDDLTKLKKLKVIFCSENQFTHVPEVLGAFDHLTMVGFKSNKISHLPKEAISKNLRWLILTDNCLREVPTNVGDCHAMQKLMLAGNQLSALPESLVNCQRLELLRISANQFENIPPWLLELPRLAWLALAGNRFNAAQEHAALAQNQLPSIDWQQLNLGKPLGEGASGIIYQATLAHPHTDFAETVAVKVFKGAVTSDGLPQSEMAAWIQAGHQENLAQLKGRLTNHPDGKQGLIMPLIDPAYKILAKPPSLDSCTRDVYESNQTLSLQLVLSIAKGVAKATAHLHERGVLHGDLYAHNTLHDNTKRVLLSDFGGASFLPNDVLISKKLQKIEVLAFGFLLEELLSICEKKNSPQIYALHTLKEHCQQTHLASRPFMSEVVDELNQIKL